MATCQRRPGCSPRARGSPWEPSRAVGAVTGAGVGESVGFSFGGTVIGRVTGRRVVCSWLVFVVLVVVVQPRPAVAVLVATGGLGAALAPDLSAPILLLPRPPSLPIREPSREVGTVTGAGVGDGVGCGKGGTLIGRVTGRSVVQQHRSFFCQDHLALQFGNAWPPVNAGPVAVQGLGAALGNPAAQSER